ncbi:MAG: EamA family transporter [Nitrosopumilaceae archaeon]
MKLVFINNIKTKVESSGRMGYVLIILAAALTGLVHTLSKPLLSYVGPSGTEINPITLAAVIYIINGLFFTPIRKNNNPIKKLDKKSLLLITIIGLAEVSGIITYFFGLKESTAVNASILTNGEIVFSILIALVIFKERLKKREYIPFSMIIAGIILIPIGYELFHAQMTLTDLILGNLLILLSGVFYAMDVNLCKYVTDKIDPKKITQVVSFVGAGFAFFLLFVLQIPITINISQLPSIAILGIFGTGVSTFFFLIAIKLIGTVRTVLLYSANFVFGVIFAIAFLHENLVPSNLASIALAIGGIYLLRNRIGKVEAEGNPTKIESKNGSFKALCNTCKHNECCTSFPSPLVFSQDLMDLKSIKKDGTEFIKEITINGKKINTIRKKNNSSTCTFWDETKQNCSIYNHRPFDCRIYPFDIYLIDGKYHWIVYSCNPESNWQWSEDYLQRLEEDSRFIEIIENIKNYSDLSEIKTLEYEIPYTVLREVNYNIKLEKIKN